MKAHSKDSFVLYAAGDIADCRKVAAPHSGAAKTAAAISSDIGSNTRYAVLALGDTVYRSGTSEEYANCYAPTWGRFKDKTYPAPGNHEYFSIAAFGYFDYFGQRAQTGRHGYYSFDLDKWHIVSINSNLDPEEHKAQLEWLIDDLKQHKSACTLAFWHHPLFSSTPRPKNEKMKDIWQALQAARADVVLNGHDHNYERYAPQDAGGNIDTTNGIRQFIAGTGGAKLTGSLVRRRNSEVSDNTAHGVLKLVLMEDGYTWEFIPAAGSDFRDRGSAKCHLK